MTRVLRVDNLIVNLLALAEVGRRLSMEQLAQLAGYAPAAAALVAEIDDMAATIPPVVPGIALQLPGQTWNRLRAMCEKELNFLTASIAVALYNAPGFRGAALAWSQMRPERVSLNNEALAEKVVDQEPMPISSVVGLGPLEETALGPMRRLVVLTQMALERPGEFAGWTDQLRWLAGWLKSEWPRPGVQP